MPKRKPVAPPARSLAPLWIGLLLAAAVFAAYGQALHFQFVTYDDPDYVTANPHVQPGLTAAGITWAFTSAFAGNWFPLTWLSHMLDCSLFGLDSGWHHFTNVILHALSTVLLFALLRRLTRSSGKSAVVALLFALHPLHVESVAWVAERKDVLSGLFWMLTLWAYAAYTVRPGRGRFALTLVLFCLGLMAKPMLVTLPLVLLLLDRWPLARKASLLEKAPFFAASLAASAVTWVVHQRAGAAAPLELIPPLVRLENAVASYVAYLLQMLWPARLAVFYPYPSDWSTLLVPALAAAAILATLTVLALREIRRRPYLAFGWLWFLITLLPVIGLVQVGAQARADRYTYIPMIGLFVALVWGTAEALAAWPRLRAALAAAACAGCFLLTCLQLEYWRDSTSLYQHAIAVTPDNYVARFNLAEVLEARGEIVPAIEQLRETVRIRPAFAPAHAELGQLLSRQQPSEEAVRELQTALRLQPSSADTHFRLGTVLGALGRNGEAQQQFSAGIELQPGNPDGHYDLAIALAQEGNLQGAVDEFIATVGLRPDDATARFNLGITLARLGRLDEAIAQLSEAVRLKPDAPEARQALDEVRALKRQTEGR